MADRSKKTKEAEWLREHPDGTEVVNFADVEDEPPPRDGDSWGRWRLQTSDMTLRLEDKGRWIYEFDLEKKHTPGTILDFIFQINGKVYVTSEDIGDFVEALEDITGNAQGVFCPFGTSRQAIPAKILLKRG
jgi:hypothetical protein